MCCRLCYRGILNLWKRPFRFVWCCCLLAFSALAPGCCQGYFQKCWRRSWSSQLGFGHLGSCFCCLLALVVDTKMLEDGSQLLGLACLAPLWWPSALGNPTSQTGSAHSLEQASTRLGSSYAQPLGRPHRHQQHIVECMNRQRQHSCRGLLQTGRYWPTHRCTKPF